MTPRDLAVRALHIVFSIYSCLVAPQAGNRVPTAQGKQVNGQKMSCQGKHREIANSAKTQGNTGNLFFTSCKFPDSKGKRYFDICRENFLISSWISLSSFVCVIVANHVNWQREKLW